MEKTAGSGAQLSRTFGSYFFSYSKDGTRPAFLDKNAYLKNTYYKFLNEEIYNWKNFLMLLACKAIFYISTLTRSERVKCLVMDDSVIGRSKKVELLSWIFDHVIYKSVKDFCMLTLAWTNVYNIIPTAFKHACLQAACLRCKRTNRARKSSFRNWKQRPHGSGSTRSVNKPFIEKTMACGNVGINVIGMPKDVKQQFEVKDGSLVITKSFRLKLVSLFVSQPGFIHTYLVSRVSF